MRLVAEQIKYLRERKKELEARRDDYKEYLQTRDRTGYDNIGLPQFGNFASDMEYSTYFKELEEIERILETSEYITERNFEYIDIGTLFSITFDNEDTEDILLVEKGIASRETRMVSIESDLGKAVLGRRPGENLTYKVEATGRTISITIDDIKRMQSDYEHFIHKNGTVSDRMSKRVRKNLKELRENNPEEYKRRHMITPSQVSLATECLARFKKNTTSNSEITRRTYLLKVINPENIIYPPEDDSVGIGSHVEILLQDEEGNVKELSFELINFAISTELSSHYVERITTLGNAIFGLRTGDTFSVVRKNKPRLKGIIKSVDNEYLKQRERVM